MNKRNKTETEGVSFRVLSQRTGVAESRINALCHRGKIRATGRTVCPKDAERILTERETYAGLPELASMLTSGSFDGASADDRDMLFEHLEKAGYYGINPVSPEVLLTGDAKDRVYFRRDELHALRDNLSRFLAECRMTEAEKVGKLLASAQKTVTVKLLKEYIHVFMYDTQITPAFTDFVRLILDAGTDITELDNEKISGLIRSAQAVRTQDYMISFLNYARRKSPVKTGFSEIKRKRQASSGPPAYDDETYLQLAVCFFSPKYVHDHRMIEKALENHLYAEMWLYLTLFFCCGSRAADITRVWQYPGLAGRPENFLGHRFRKKTLKEDILQDRIPDEAYEAVCRFAVGMVDAAGKTPSKTSSRNPPPMAVLLSEKMFVFFGMLTLIAEVHMLQTGKEGYMRENRTSDYQNKMRLKEFFGAEIKNVLKGGNILATRLNKVLLQGAEHTARQLGYGGILSSTVASYLRAHKDLDTIRIYLRDRRLTGETADFVLFNMMDRGVFGFLYYHTLLAAYPEAMDKLSMQEQSRLIGMIHATPLETELAQSGVLVQSEIGEEFEKGDKDAALGILRDMYEITQGRGSAKDKGVYCLLRAKQEACAHPQWESCIANACPHLVLTRYGIRPLLEVIIKYRDRALTGDKKAEAVLKTIIIPRYKDILNTFMRETGMRKEEREGLLLMMKEAV